VLIRGVRWADISLVYDEVRIGQPLDETRVIGGVARVAECAPTDVDEQCAGRHVVHGWPRAYREGANLSGLIPLDRGRVKVVIELLRDVMASVAEP
jgi:hypothetical protein